MTEDVYLDGYLRFLPQKAVPQCIALLERSSIWNGGIPFAVTAFCDVLVWEEDGFIDLYRLIDGENQIILSGSEFFFDVIADEDYQRDYFDLAAYRLVKEKLGTLNADQCYVYEPIPAFGGTKSLEAVSVGKTLPYLAILCEAS
jgi:hypothetical protein